MGPRLGRQVCAGAGRCAERGPIARSRPRARHPARRGGRERGEGSGRGADLPLSLRPRHAGALSPADLRRRRGPPSRRALRGCGGSVQEARLQLLLRMCDGVLAVFLRRLVAGVAFLLCGRRATRACTQPLPEGLPRGPGTSELQQMVIFSVQEVTLMSWCLESDAASGRK
nr:uncharacterized protein LOC106845992 [Equus asinus]